MIVETSDNRFYCVKDAADPALDHVWIGYPVKFNKNLGQWIQARLGGRTELVRKEASRVVEA